ncbi:MAG: hypothetical protein F7C81_04940 [Desulfurococcales archaeon]|nr:hypothetical protein [Desulfurococcales archaeon]
MSLKKLSTVLIGVSVALAIIAFYTYPLSEADIASALPDYPSSPKFAGSTVMGVKSRVNTTIEGIISDYRIVGKTLILIVNTEDGERVRVIAPGSWVKMAMMHRGCIAEEGVSSMELLQSILNKRAVIHGVTVKEDDRRFMIAWGIMVFDDHMVRGYMRSDVAEKMGYMMAQMGMRHCIGEQTGWMPMGRR